MKKEEQWLLWARRIQSLAQSGLAFSKIPYDRDRYEELREIAVDIVANHSDSDHKTATELFANETGYQTPKLDVRGAVIRDGKILLVHEKIDGKWALPGGYADVNLSMKENVEKEIYEEAGVKAEAVRLIAMLDRRLHVSDMFPYSIYKAFFLCDYRSGEFAHNTETVDARFFAPDDLPPLSLGRTNEDQIRMCYDFLADPARPALFD